MFDRDLISEVFGNLCEKKIDQLMKYSELLADWNTKINLVSRKDVKNIVRKHIIPSLSISKIVGFNSSDSVLDVGTGGGLPGFRWQ